MVITGAKREVICELHRCGTDDVIRITNDRVLIGSHRHCDVTIRSTTIAPVNCQIVFQAGGWSVRNLADFSQTKLNGRDIIEAPLRAGDILWIGATHKYVVQFAAPGTNARTEEVPAFLRLRDGDWWSEPLQLQQSHTFGRGAGNTTSFPDDRQCSREHCEILREGGTWIIRDLDSRNGTRVNGEPITSSVELRDNDLVTVGNQQFMIYIGKEGGGDETRCGIGDTKPD